MIPFPFQHGGFGLRGTVLTPSVGDPYWANVVLSIDGTQGSVVDLSSIGHTITAEGNAAAAGSGGTGYLDFDTSGDAFSIASSSSFGFGTGDYTIELDIYRVTSGTETQLIDTRILAEGTPRP